MVRTGVAVLAAMLGFAVGVGTLGAQEIGIGVGTVPQAVSIEDLDGNAVDLGQYIGKRPVIVEFWATWCPLCEALAPRLETVGKRYGDRVEILVVAVAVNQSKRSIRRHLDKHPAPGRVLWDTEGRATRAFLAPSTSYIVVLDAAGRVVYTGVGTEQDIEAVVAKLVKG